jgi:hypothetical protein
MRLTQKDPMTILGLRIIFFAALLFTIVMALLPKPPHLILDNFGDKFEHSLAFVVLTALALLAFPRMPALRTGERLSFLGALIEVFQSIPVLHRDCDPLDWLTDTIAIIATILVITVIQHRLHGPKPRRLNRS